MIAAIDAAVDDGAPTHPVGGNDRLLGENQTTTTSTDDGGGDVGIDGVGIPSSSSSSSSLSSPPLASSSSSLPPQPPPPRWSDPESPGKVDDNG